MTSNTISRRLSAPVAIALALGLAGCGVFGGKDKPSTPTVGKRIPILSKVDTSAKVDPALATVVVGVPLAEVNQEWPQAGATASKSYGNLALSATPSQVWTQKIAGSSSKQRLAAAPVIGGGRLFVMDTEGTVHAFDAASGAAAWSQSFQIKGDNQSSVYGGGVSFNDGRHR